MSRFSFLFLATIPFYNLTPIHAAGEYVEIAACGTASVLSGDTCSNVKVEFQLGSCEAKTDKAVVEKMICDQNTIKARYHVGDLRYEARFEKAAGSGWGGVNWKALGPVRQLKRNTVAAAAPAAMKATDTPAVRTIANEPGKWSFSAFADLRYTKHDQHGPSSGDTISGNAYSGFALEDGAFYADYTRGKLTAKLDLSIRREKASDDANYTDGGLDAPGTTGNTSNNGDLILAQGQSQIYFKYQMCESLSLTAGQFDTIYGVELNDSKDRVFGASGLVYNKTIPVTHMGSLLEYKIGGATLKALAANPNNKGTYGSANNDHGTEYGAAVSYANDMIRGQVGYLSRAVTEAGATTRASRTLVDVVAGVTFGSFNLDAQYSQVADPGKDTLSDVATDEEDNGTGLMVLAAYDFNENFKLGVRYEKISDDPLGSEYLENAVSYGASAHYKISPELKVRAEFVYDRYENNDHTEMTSGEGQEWSERRYMLGGLLTF